MPTYIITSPDGKKYRVTGEGTKEEALAQVQKQASQSMPTVSKYDQGEYAQYSRETGLPPYMKDVQEKNKADLMAPVTMAKNIPGSAANYASGIYQAVRHPIETVKSLGGMVAGGAESLIPGEQGHEQDFQSLVNFYKDRYGSFENLRQTMINDPVGFAADASLALGAAGKIPGPAGQALTSASQAIDPLNIAAKGVMVPVKLLAKADKKLYQSAVKMPQKVGGRQLTPEMRAQIATTGLENGIIPNPAGYSKLMDKIDDVNRQITDHITTAGQAGETVKTAEIVKTLDDMRAFYSNTFDPKPFLDQIDDLQNGLINTYGTDIPIAKAQQIKQNTYRLLKKQYGEMKGIAIEGQKQLARGVKEEISRMHPEIAALNKTDSALIQLEEVIGKAVNRISNRDVMGIGIPAKTAAGAGIDIATGSGGTGAMAGLISGILDTPTVKARLAVALNKAGKMKVRIPGENIRNIGYQIQSISDLESQK